MKIKSCRQQLFTQYLNECRKESKGLQEKCHARLKEIEQGRFDAMKRKEKELAEKKKAFRKAWYN
jgi:hypothetical protein